MKVFQVLNHFLPFHIAGTEMYVYSLSKSLLSRGIEVQVIVPNLGIAATEEYVFEGIKVFKYAETSIPDRELIMGRRDTEGLPFFLEILRNEKPDIVHFHELAGSNGISYRHVEETHRLGIKTVMTFHLSGYSCKTGHLMYKDRELCDGVIRPFRCSLCYNHVKIKSAAYPFSLFPISALLYAAGIDTSSWNSKFGTALAFPFLISKLRKDLHHLADNCDALITLTKWYKIILEKNGIPPDKLTHIAQGLTEQKDTAEQVFARATGHPARILFVGRISAFKGLHLLIEALKGIDPAQIQLDIFGVDLRDEYSKGLKEASASMQNISWKGVLQPGRVSETMRHYDLLCLPSTFSEMSPLVIPEAFAAGIPVLASDVYGNAEQIEDGVNGWLFKFNDATDLRKKIQWLIGHPSMIEKAKEAVPAVRSFNRVAEEQLAVYKKIIIT